MRRIRCYFQKSVPLFLTLVLSLLVSYSGITPVAAAPSAQLQNDSKYVDSLGYFHVVGEVLNTGDAWLEFVKITGTFKNASGQIVDVTFTYTDADYLPPQAKTPFDLIEIETAKAPKITSYSLVVEFRQASARQNVLVIQGASSSIDSIGYYNIVGQVKNNGPTISNYTKIIATYYNASGKVIYVDFTFTSPDAIPPGQLYGFKIIGPSAPISNRVKSYAITAESSQYTSVPEFPWRPSILAGVVLTFTLMILRRKDKASV